MILWRRLKIIHFYYFDSDFRFPPFLLCVRWKSGVTFVRRCFRDAGISDVGLCVACFWCHFLSTTYQIRFDLRLGFYLCIVGIYLHGKETRDYSASFPFLNWRPPLRLIDQLAIYFLVFLR